MQTSSRQQNHAAKAFWLAFFIASAIFLPLMVYNRGLFLFIGDFNVQQIPFYKLAHEAVRSGNIFWSWKTDLGANFVGSYSFYLLFSPFFWLTLPFPNSFVPYLMGPLLILKTACAALTSYHYIKRFVTNREYAVIGALLYAFSGYMTFNIFFNHFHEVAVFFPLLLIALEELVTNDRKGLFAAMVALNCIVNYWFFIGEVVFVVLYVIVRLATGGWGCTVRKFCLIVFESIVGLMLAMAALLPSVLGVLGNPRTGTDSLLTGWLMWIYGYNQRLPAIIQSFFFPPELPSRPNFFPEMGAKWASLSAWLPLFSTVGVIAYCRGKQRDFFKRMIVLSMIMAVVPVFNAAFVLFNHSYYARWFYMPILMMCVATATALSERHALKEELEGGYRWTAGFILAFSAAIAFSPKKVEDKLTFGLYDDARGFFAIVVAAMVCLLLLRILLVFLTNHKQFERITTAMLAFVIVGFTLPYIASGKDVPANDNWFIDKYINGRDSIILPTGQFARSDFYECGDNVGMFWGLPNIQTFHSIVPPSIMEFYPSIGVKRDVSSKPSTQYEALRDMLSVKWLFIPENHEQQSPMGSYSFYDTQNGYNIYKNDNYIPMGFCYDKGISEELVKELSGEQRSRYMLSALILSEEALIRNGDILNVQTEVDYGALADLQGAINSRREITAERFVINRRGFVANVNLSEPQLMFFSVPYDRGWSATVDGSPAVIERANTGFMAVRVPSGVSEVRFVYTTPGAWHGFLVTCAGLFVLLLYLIVCFVLGNRKPTYLPAVVLKEKQEPKTLTDLEDALGEITLRRDSEQVTQHYRELLDQMELQLDEEEKQL